MSNLLNFLAYATGIGFTLSTLYSKYYIKDYGKSSIWFLLVITIFIIIFLKKLLKELNEEIEIQKIDKFGRTFNDPEPKYKWYVESKLFIWILVISFSIFKLLKYIENREEPASYTFLLIFTAWGIAYVLKLFAMWFERKKLKKEMKKEET